MSPYPQSTASPGEDGGLAQVANLSLSNAAIFVLLLPLLPRLLMKYLPRDSLYT